MFWKATGSFNCFPPASSPQHLVSNSQHAAFLYEKTVIWALGGLKREWRRKRANNSAGTGWREKDAQGIQLRFPVGYCFSAPFNHLFYSLPPPSFFPPRDFCVVFYHPAHFCSFVFILPTPTPLPPTVFPDRNLTHAFLF